MSDEQRVEDVVQVLDGGLFDKDGYPTEATLDRIKTWQPLNDENWYGLMNYIKRAWYYPNRFIDEGIIRDEDAFDKAGEHQYYLSTGGWSGNEEVLHAMKSNFVFWSMCWYQSNRGGHYLFRLKLKKEEDK